MKASLVGVLICGCYQPANLASGAPCTVADPTCPTGQTCIRVAGDFRCEPDGTNPNSPDAGPVAPGIDAPGGVTMRKAYPATVTACIAPAYPGTDLCTSLYDDKDLVVTKLDQLGAQPLEAYLRFDFDNTLAGKTIAAVTLEMTTLGAQAASSDATGSVWTANPFTAASIDMTAPTKASTPVLAADHGAVAVATPVDWNLPLSVFVAGTASCLEIESTSTNNVIYGAKGTSAPPTIFVDYF